ncbi:MAG: hypothetical protein ACO1RA_04870 [Planctomycetaceae bacterium]
MPDGIFSISDAKDKIYIALRDNSKFEKSRKFIEYLWSKFAPYADHGFIAKIANDFQTRFWEMYLAVSVMKNGHSITSDESGPDVKVTTFDTPIWIEAINRGIGNSPDSLELTPQCEENGGMVPEEAIVLRLNGAVKQKHKKYLNYLRQNIIADNSPFVIAVNGHDLPFQWCDTQPSYILQALLPIGADAISINTTTLEITSRGYALRPKIVRRSGESIDTTIFQNSKYRGVSGVLYSTASDSVFSQPWGFDFQFIHNPNASNPLPLGWLKCGIELWKDGPLVAMKRWNPSANRQYCD